MNAWPTIRYVRLFICYCELNFDCNNSILLVDILFLIGRDLMNGHVE